MSASLAEYRHAATLLWGEAGRYIVDTFDEHNRTYFDGALPPVPMVIGLTAYGHCVGLTRAHNGRTLPRISIASPWFGHGHHAVADTVLHEMIHAHLVLGGYSPEHNGHPWCEMVMRLSPAVLGHEVAAEPVGTRRVPNPARKHDPTAAKTIVVRRARDGYLTRDELAGWPYACRDHDWNPGEPIPVDTY